MGFSCIKDEFCPLWFPNCKQEMKRVAIPVMTSPASLLAAVGHTWEKRTHWGAFFGNIHKQPCSHGHVREKKAIAGVAS